MSSEYYEGYQAGLAEKKLKSVDDAIDLLNTAMLADPEAMDALLKCRVECNEKMGDHPTIQCGNYRPRSETLAFVAHPEDYPQEERDEKVLSVGILGILNGIFGLQSEEEGQPGWGYIAAIVNDAGEVQSFVRSDKVSVGNEEADEEPHEIDEDGGVVTDPTED